MTLTAPSDGASAPAAPGSSTDAVTPSVRRPSRRRAILTWLGIGVFLIVVGLIGAALSGVGAWAERAPLDPDGVGRDGTRALVRILEEQGVEVVVARDRVTARAALGDGDATLVTGDAPYLSDDALGELFEAAADVVLIDPRSRTIDLLLPGAESGGFAPDAAVDPDCELSEAQRAGAVIPGRTFEDASADDVVACYPADGAFGLLTGPRDDGGRSSIVDGRELFVNERLAENGNAALALGLMGRHATVVWYVATPADSDLGGGDASLGELTPGWVTPVIVLLAAAALAAAFWRGRRFGPLVFERLPVTVRASETMEGRGRLYARARDHVRAADALRMGATTRLARMLGLAASAPVHEVADAAAEVIGAPRATIRGLLVDDLPGTDRELMSISDGLRDLEAAVRAAIRDEGRRE